MTLKSIDMQIALPRTNDAGMVQNQLSQKPIQDQTAMAALESKKMEEMRHKSVRVDEPAHLSIRDEHPQKDRRRNFNSKKQKQKTNREHPYKGHHIDLSL